MALAGKITGISLTDAKPILSIDRSLATGDLSNIASTNGTDLLLQKITSTFTLKLTNVGAADAATIKAPSKHAALQISVVDTAENISSNLAALQRTSKSKSLNDITISSSNHELLLSSAAQLKSDADALKAITNSYSVELTHVSAIDIGLSESMSHVTNIDVVDSMRNILSHLTSLSTSAASLKLLSVTVTDKSNPTVSLSDAKALKTLPNLTYQTGIKLNIADTSNNIISQARYDAGNLIADAGLISLSGKSVPVLTLADAKTLTSIQNLSSNTKYSIADDGNVLATQAKITNETVLSRAKTVNLAENLSIDNAAALISEKPFDSDGNYSITDSISNIMAQVAKPGDKLLSQAATVNVSDTSANILAHLDDLETLAQAGKINDIIISDPANVGYIGISSDKITSDHLAVGKILAQVVALPSASVSLSAVTNPAVVSQTGADTYYLPPRAARSDGDLLWSTETISTSNNPSGSNSAINTFDVNLTPQNSIGTIGYDATTSAGTVTAQGVPGGTVVPMLFNTNDQTGVSTGGIVKFNETSTANGIDSYNVTFNAITVTNSDASTHPTTPSQISTTVSSSATTLLSNLTLDSTKNETYTWSSDKNGFVVVWSKQHSVAANGTASYDLNVAHFNTAGTQIGSTTVLSNALTISAQDKANGNYYQFDTIDNNHLLIGNGLGGTKIVTIDSGASSTSIVPDLDPGSYSAIGNYSSFINPDSNGVDHSIILSFSGTKSGQNVVEYYAVDTTTMSVIGQSGPISTTSHVTNMKGGFSLSDGSTTIFGYQDGNTLHTQMIDGLGHLVSDITTTLPSGAKLDRYKPLGNGQFEAVWQQPDGSTGGNELAGQIFDTRTSNVTEVGSTSTPTLFAGTSGNDKIVVDTAGSIVEGGAGADTLIATARAYNATLSYDHSSSGVIVDLSRNYTNGGDATGDTISGFASVIGSNYSDVLVGASNGYVYGGGGNDRIFGDGKSTIAMYSGKASDYSLSMDATGTITITDNRNGSPDGTDTLSGIVSLKFSDSTLLLGSNTNDKLNATSFGYVFGGIGNDIITGDGITTTAIYSGQKSDYSISNNSDGSLTISDNRAGSPDGTDTLRSVAYLQFSDGTFSSSTISQSGSATSIYSGQGGYPDSVKLSNGSTVIAYSKLDQQGYFKIIDAHGNASSEISLGPLPSNISRVAMLSVTPTQNGGFMVSGMAAGLDADIPGQWNPSSYRGGFFELFDSSGQSLSPFTLTNGTGYNNWTYGSSMITPLGNNQILSVGHTGNGAWHAIANIQNSDGSYVVQNLSIAQHGTSFSPKATLSTDGRHVLFVWSDLNGSGGAQDNSGSSVWGRVYDVSTHQFSTNEFIINKTTQGNQGGRQGVNDEADNYSIVATSDGGFEVAYRSDTNGVNLLTTTIGNAQANFNVGSEKVVNDPLNGNVLFFDSAKLANGNIFVAYSTTQNNGSNGRLYGKVIDPSGNTVLSDFQIGNTNSGSIYPRVSSNGDNSVDVSWDDYSGTIDGGFHTSVTHTAKISL